MDDQANTLEFLAASVRNLAAARIQTWLFGGWAEELSGLRLPGLHQDIDLLYPVLDFSALDAFLRTRDDCEELEAKRFVHKRAFWWRGVLVEVFLLCPQTAGYVTNFFGIYPYLWPEDTLFYTVPLLGEMTASASQAALHLYRLQHKDVEDAYRQHLLIGQSRER